LNLAGSFNPRLWITGNVHTFISAFQVLWTILHSLKTSCVSCLVSLNYTSRI
jgi:hypothetical protein